MARANSLIFEQSPLGMYLTAVYGILDTATGQFSYTVGGHDPPILCTRDGIALAPRAGGMLLGLLDREVFAENTVQLAVGDTVILFTDGVTECFNPDGAVLGEARLLALAAMLADRSPAQMVEGVVAGRCARRGPGTIRRHHLPSAAVRTVSCDGQKDGHVKPSAKQAGPRIAGSMSPSSVSKDANKSRCDNRP